MAAISNPIIAIGDDLKFPSNTVLWLKTKIISSPEYIPGVLSRGNYDAIESKYTAELSAIRDPSNRKKALAQKIWQELCTLAERSTHIPTREASAQMIQKFRDRWRDEKLVFYRLRDTVERGLALSNANAVFIDKVRLIPNDDNMIVPIQELIDKLKCEFMQNIYNIVNRISLDGDEHLCNLILAEIDQFAIQVPNRWTEHYRLQTDEERKHQAAELLRQVDAQFAQIDIDVNDGDGDGSDDDVQPCGCCEPEVKRFAIKMADLIREIDRKTCSICLVDYDSRDCVTFFKCGHMFHVACVKKWDKPSCPLCRVQD